MIKSENKSNKSQINRDKSDLNGDKSLKSNLKTFNDLFVPVFEITPSGNGDITTVLTLVDVIATLGKNHMWVQSNSTHIDTARTDVFKAMKKALKQLGHEEKIVRGFIVDSDIVVHPKYAETIILNMKLADEMNYNFVIPYRVNEDTDIIKKDGRKMTIDEYHKIDNLSKVFAAGLGFYYGDIILDYEFYQGNFSEDINYMVDNKLDVRVCKDIHLFHKKPVMLGIAGNVYI